MLASLAAALTFLFHVLGWQFTADGMIMGITVLCAQQMPDAQISLYGINIPYAAAHFSAQFCAQCSSARTTLYRYAYLPFAQLVMSYVFQQQVPFTDIAGLLVGYAHYHFNDNLKPDSARAPAPPAKKGARAGGAAGGGRRSGGARREWRRSADLSDGNAQ